jgi:hypothetical protein
VLLALVLLLLLQERHSYQLPKNRSPADVLHHWQVSLLLSALRLALLLLGQALQLQALQALKARNCWRPRGQTPGAAAALLLRWLLPAAAAAYLAGSLHQQCQHQHQHQQQHQQAA